jgi:hypothetical protein
MVGECTDERVVLREKVSEERWRMVVGKELCGATVELNRLTWGSGPHRSEVGILY